MNDAQSEQQRPRTEALEDMLNGTIVARVGLGLLLLGLIFLFRWSVTQGWIGPVQRVGAGVALSLVLIGAGVAVRGRSTSFARLLEGGGVAGLYLSAFAAHRVYELVSPSVGLIQLGVVAAVAIAMALDRDDQTLAVVGVLGGFAAPVLIGAGGGLPGDFVFVSVVLATAAAIHFVKGWSGVHLTAMASMIVLVGIRVIGIEFADGAGGGVVGDRLAEWSGSAARWDVQLGLIAGAVALWLTPMARALRHRVDDTASRVAAATIPFLVVVGSLATWTTSSDPAAVTRGWVAICIAAAIIVASVGMGLRHAGLRELGTLHLLPTAALVALAAIVGLDGPALQVAMAVEAAALVVVGVSMRRRWTEYLGHVGFAATALTVVERLGVPRDDVTIFLNGRAVAEAIVIMTGGFIAWVMAEAGAREMARSGLVDDRAGRGKDHSTLAGLYAVTSYATALGWIAVELGRVDNGSPVVTFAWGVLGVMIFGFGVSTDRRPVRTAGILTIGLAVTKLIAVDIATVGTGWKIVLFMAFGIMLLLGGFWLSRRDGTHPGRPTDTPDAAHPGSGPAAGEPADERRSSAGVVAEG